MATLQNLTWTQYENYIKARPDLSQEYKDQLNFSAERAAYQRPISAYNSMVAARDVFINNFRWANYTDIGVSPLNLREEYIGLIDDLRRTAEEAVAWVNANGG